MKSMEGHFARILNFSFRVLLWGSSVAQLAYSSTTPLVNSASSGACIALLKEVDGRIRAIEGYKTVVANLREGNEISFSNGKSFTIAKVIKKHGADTILLLTDGTVLRIQSKLDAETVNSFIDGYKTLKDAGIPVPTIKESLRDEYVRVEYIQVEMLFADFLKRMDSFPAAKVENMKEKFKEFVAKFKDFNEVADFSAWQIAYSPDRGWVLLDWRKRHDKGNDRNPFENVFSGLGHSIENEARAREWKLLTDKVLATLRGQ